MENAGNCSAATTQVIDIRHYGGMRDREIEMWLQKQMLKDYGDDNDVAISNPLLRILTLFDAMSGVNQQRLYDYSIERIGGCQRLRDSFWNVLEKGSRVDGSWKDIEKFAGSLIIKEKII